MKFDSFMVHISYVNNICYSCVYFQVLGDDSFIIPMLSADNI